MLGQFTWENQADRGLNFSTSNCGSLVHAAELRCFVGDLVEGISHEVVHDRNALLGDARLRVDLLHHLEDVAVVALDTLAAPDRLLDGVLIAGSHGEKVVRLSTQTTLRVEITQHSSEVDP